MPIQEFLDFLNQEKRYSKHTVKSYSVDLGQCRAFLYDEFDCDDILKSDRKMLRAWVVYLLEEGLSSKSVNRKISALQSFFDYFRRRGVVSGNPAKQLTRPKIAKKLPVFVDEQGMNKLLDQHEFADDIYGFRDKLMITLFYLSGIRLSELIGLKQSDLDTEKQTVKVLGKRNKERVLPISKELAIELENFVLQKEREGITERGYLFFTDRGQKLNEKFVYRKVNRYLSLVATQKKRSPHVLRHTFATHMLNNGAEINSVKEMLGHSSLVATQVYTHNTVEKLKRAYQSAHPRSDK
jgi:integrase/recombinase XerC